MSLKQLSSIFQANMADLSLSSYDAMVGTCPS